MNAENDIPSTMKAVVVRKTGDAPVLEVDMNYPTPVLPLQPGHVLVKNDYAGLNFIDTYHRKGLYPRTLPFIAGQEGGGTIVAVNLLEQQDDDNEFVFKIGDRVAYTALESYCDYTSVPIDNLVSVPENVSMEVAVACMVQGLTAHYLVTSAPANLIQKDDWCLIYSVGSGTCQWAAQMASHKMGYKVIGTCSKNKADAVRALNCCDELIVLEQQVEGAASSYANYDSVDIVSKVMDITKGVGVKCILDGVGKSTVDISLNCLATRGIFISFGNASGTVPAFPLLKLVPKSAYVTRPKLGDYMTTRAELSSRAKDVLGWVQDGTLKITVDKVFDLDQAVEGHLYLESGKSKGKVLYKI